MATKKDEAIDKDKQVSAGRGSLAVPDYIKQNATRGNEEVGTDDVQIPRIDVLQALSPQINKKKPEYIEGSEQGLLFNTLTGELLGAAITFVPVYFRKHWLVWKDRDSGGGLRGMFDTADEAEAHISKQEDAQLLEAQETAEHIVLVIREDGSVDEAMLSWSRSKLKVSRKLNSLVRLSTVDRFARVYTLAAVEDKNSANQDFYNVAVSYNMETPFPEHDVYKRAEALYESIVSGRRKVTSNYDQPEGSDAGGGSTDDTKNDDDI